MAKRLLLALLCLSLVLPLSGCWNYRGLDQMSIVVGIAIDFDQEAGLFDISYEVADLSSGGKDASVKGKIVHAKGKTLFEAARNAKLKEPDRLFFGAAHVLVINQQLVRDTGINSILEWFLRDAECRETMCVAISQEATAEELLQSPEGAQGIMAVTLHDIIKEDQDVTGTAPNTRLYEIFNRLNSPRRSVLLPVLRKTQNGKDLVPELNGAALLKEGKLAGFLPPEQSRYALLMEGTLNKGVLTLSASDLPGDDVTLEILSSKAKKSYVYDQGKVILKVDATLDVVFAENRDGLDVMDKQVVRRVEALAAEMIQKHVAELMDVLQHTFAADVFGFGEMIYKRNLPLWRQLAPTWDTLYPQAEARVSAEVHILNPASIR